MPLKALRIDQIEWIVTLAEGWAVNKRGMKPKWKSDIKPSLVDGDEPFLEGAPTSYRLLLDYLKGLTPEALSDLSALVWLGRGDAPLDQVIRHARSSRDRTTPYYLADLDGLAGYIRAGCLKLGIRDLQGRGEHKE